MRIFAVSDLHVDHPANRQWVEQISGYDHKDDVLILAGDVSDSLKHLQWCMQHLAKRFHKVVFVPGNHELWVLRDPAVRDSLEKFSLIGEIADNCGVSMRPFVHGDLAIIPLFGWYDYSFGEPCDYLRTVWMDYRACRWPSGLEAAGITDFFLGLNTLTLEQSCTTVITFSHFVPSPDLLPDSAQSSSFLNPVLGCRRLEEQIRALGATMHVFGHSHLARRARIGGITYVNNALGTPRERKHGAQGLLQLHEC